jgi:hypothetical protein
MDSRRMVFASVWVVAVLLVLCGCGKAETGASDGVAREAGASAAGTVQRTPRLVLYYASVACECTMQRCQAALALCDSMVAGDSSVVYETIDVYSDSLAADSVAVWDVPRLVLFDGIGHERGRLEWDVTADDVYFLLQKGRVQ